MTISNSSTLNPQKFSTADITTALTTGWDTYRSMPVVSMMFAVPFVVIGLVLLGAIGQLGMSPMALPFAGGFMLIGPILLTGFFQLAAIQAEGRKPRLKDAYIAFAHAPVGLWLLAGLCAFLFLIWITDAGVLYSFMIGGEHLPYELPWLISLQEHIVAFVFWGSLMGSAIAYIIFAISAFSVPLLYEGRATMVQAVHASVRAVLGNFLTGIVWGLILSAATLLSILLLPLLMIVFPVLAYASFELYQKVFPAR